MWSYCYTGAVDIGQGSTTAVAQVVAEVLALPIETFTFEVMPARSVDLGSYSSRVTFMNANAAIRAALEIKEKLLDAAWDTLGYHPDTWYGTTEDYYKHDPAIGMSYPRLYTKHRKTRVLDFIWCLSFPSNGRSTQIKR